MASATSARPLSIANEPTVPALTPSRIVPINTTLVL